MPIVFGLIMVAVLLYALFSRVGFLLTSLVLFTDSLAHASRWIGVTNPAVGWLLLGVVGGAMAGAFVGMRRAGRAVSARQLRGCVMAVGAGLLVAGSYPPRYLPSSRVTTAAGPAASNINITPSPMRVATARVSVRTAPDAASAVVGTLPAHTRLDVFRLSVDGAWWYVEARRRGARAMAGWVRRSSLADDIPDPPRTRVAGTPGQVQSAAGEVTLAPDAPTPRAPTSGAPTPRAVDSTPSKQPVPDSALRRGGQRELRPSGGYGGRVGADRDVVADVQAKLADARAGVGAGDYAAALRALAAADEGVAIAVAKYGDADWVTALQRDAAAARTSTRTACQAAATAASGRGETPPLCQ